MVAQSPEPGAHVTNARLFNSTMEKDQTTTPGTTRPTLYDKCVGSLTSPANQNNEDRGDGAYGLSSLSERLFKFSDLCFFLVKNRTIALALYNCRRRPADFIMLILRFCVPK